MTPALEVRLLVFYPDVWWVSCAPRTLQIQKHDSGDCRRFRPIACEKILPQRSNEMQVTLPAGYLTSLHYGVDAHFSRLILLISILTVV